MWNHHRQKSSTTKYIILLLWLAASFNHAFLLSSHVRGNHPQAARSWRYTEEDGESSLERELSTEVPTETMAALPEPDVIPSKPKIVVLGATGKIGRLVVRQLLETSNNSLGGDATIVAVVRDYDKACRVLYDDMMYVKSKKKQQPTLQIVEANLVPPEELPGYDAIEQEEDEEWLKRASSAAAFYGTSVQEYDNRNDGTTASSLNNNNNNNHEVLEDAIRGCTAIISCVGSVRPTNLWTDFLVFPLLRVMRKDVSSWCQDPRHPYYVHYWSTRNVLALAEKEQLRRQSIQTLADDPAADVKQKLSFSRDNKDQIDRVPSRIRFVRISDLCVSQQPWHFVPLLTNIMHSMVFRYQEMTEQLLQSSPWIDTIILRPGDLTDDERNVNTTALQVDPSGRLPSPSRVGREDVASLALSSALFRIPNPKANNNTTTDDRHQAVHFTLAVRWVGENLHPYPTQGSFQDGLASAHACLRSVIQPSNAISFTAKRRRNIKPYALCTAIPVYTILFLLLRSLTHGIVPLVFTYLPGTKTFLLPLFSRICELGALLCGILAGKLGTLQPLSSLKFGKSVPKFISF